MTTDLATLRRQLQQLDELHAGGAIGADAYAQGKARLERQIVEHVMQAGDAATTLPQTPAVPAPRPSRRLLAAVALGVVVFAVAGYWWTGSPDLAGVPVAATAPAGGDDAASHETGAAQIAAMVERLASRLQDRPEDAEGWAMLARSYAVLGRHAEAVPTYRKALALGGDDAGVLTDLADALGVVNGRNLAGEPTRLIERALKLDPDHVKALALAGTAAYDRKDYANAVRHWERIVQVAPAGSSYLEQVRASIAEARELGGLPAAKAPPAPPQAAAANASVSGTVTIAPELAARASPQDTVFVYARAADGRMPLAIVRRTVADLPFEFRLDDSLAMSPAAKLSTQSRVVIAARVSKSGDATPKAGDFAGQSAPVAVGASGLKIVIAQTVGPQ